MWYKLIADNSKQVPQWKFFHGPINRAKICEISLETTIWSSLWRSNVWKIFFTRMILFIFTGLWKTTLVMIKEKWNTIQGKNYERKIMQQKEPKYKMEKFYKFISVLFFERGKSYWNRETNLWGPCPFHGQLCIEYPCLWIFLIIFDQNETEEAYIR